MFSAGRGYDEGEYRPFGASFQDSRAVFGIEDQVPSWEAPGGISKVCRRTLQDEAGHMGFGMLALPEIVAKSRGAERQEMEEFTYWALVRNLTQIGFLTPRTVAKLESLGNSLAPA